MEKRKWTESGMEQVLKEPAQVSEWAFAVFGEEVMDGGNMGSKVTNTSKHGRLVGDILK